MIFSLIFSLPSDVLRKTISQVTFDMPPLPFPSIPHPSPLYPPPCLFLYPGVSVCLSLRLSHSCYSCNSVIILFSAFCPSFFNAFFLLNLLLKDVEAGFSLFSFVIFFFLFPCEFSAVTFSCQLDDSRLSSLPSS